MGVIYTQGQNLGRGDLDLFLTNANGNPENAFTLTYAIYYVDPSTQSEVLIGSPTRVPVNPAVGEYYAALQVPPNAAAGDYRVRWTFQELSNTPAQQVVQEFGVVSPLTTNIGTAGSNTNLSSCEAGLLRTLRVMLGDNDPDRTYHFRPPENQTTVGCNNQVFGYIWTDSELLEILNTTLDKWNMQAPATSQYCTVNAICQSKPEWKAALIWGSIVSAAMMMAFRWTSEEFDYSIGGISLSIDKTSKYMDLKRNAEEQWDKLVEAKQKTSLYVRGLKQQRFGVGIRSAFGPATGRGVLSPRSFLVFAFFVLNSGWVLSLIQGIPEGMLS